MVHFSTVQTKDGPSDFIDFDIHNSIALTPLKNLTPTIRPPRNLTMEFSHDSISISMKIPSRRGFSPRSEIAETPDTSHGSAIYAIFWLRCYLVPSTDK